MAKRLNKHIEHLKKKYRLIIYNDQTYEEIWSGRISKMTVGVYLLLFVLFLLSVIIITLIFTPANKLLPAYADSELQNKIIETAKRVDSIEYQIKIRDQYIDTLKKVIRGEVHGRKAFNKVDSYTSDNYTPSKHDSILRLQIEEEERFNVSVLSQKEGGVDFSKLHFFVPLKGIITNVFNREEKHFGIDIVASPSKAISATLDGTVISADWTLATGYVIQIQHDNQLISFYKHNAVLLKKPGDHVKAGETIAILGNTGKYSTGPHLHFELWHNGLPLNPADYILF